MNGTTRAFSTDVELACRVAYGPNATLELSCKALKMDPHSMLIAVPPHALSYPHLGEVVQMEVQLPVHFEPASAKCLRLRARVARVQEMTDGVRHFQMTFRKVSFREPERKQAVRKPPKAAAGLGGCQ